jgi:hypothetical protein
LIISGIAFELADDRARVDVIDAGHAHPLADDAEVHAVVLLARVRRIAGAMQVQDHVVPARPLRHRLDRRVADHEVDHDDARAERSRKLGALVHVLHRAGGHVEIVTLHFAGRGRRLVDRFHAIEKSVAPVHERLRVDVLVVLDEIEPALQRFVDHAPVVAAREAELGLRRRAEQRAAELVEALALDDDAGRRSLERLEVRDRNAHVLEAQRLDRLEAEHVADDRRGEVRDRAGLEEIEVVRDVREVLLLGLRAGAGVRHGIDAIRLGAIKLARGEPIGPDDGPCRGGRFAGDGGRGFVGIDAGLRRDAEERNHVRLDRHVIRLPIAHLLVRDDAGLVALGDLLAGADGRDGCVHRTIPLSLGLTECTGANPSGIFKSTATLHKFC